MELVREGDLEIELVREGVLVMELLREGVLVMELEREGVNEGVEVIDTSFITDTRYSVTSPPPKGKVMVSLISVRAVKSLV